MIRKLVYITLCCITVACDSESANDCFQTAGETMRLELPVESFDRILVNDLIEMILIDGAAHSVVVETGANLINDVEAQVIAGRLELTNNNTCNFVRDFGITKIYVTAPNITEIRSDTRFDIRSEGVLTYPQLVLFSETFNAPETSAVGDFRLHVDNTRVRVVFNNLSNLFIEGRTDVLDVNFAAGNSRLEGERLEAQEVIVFHRGTNDMIVNPIRSLSGSIVSTGNVIAVNRPPTVAVEELFRGRLIFLD